MRTLENSGLPKMARFFDRCELAARWQPSCTHPKNRAAASTEVRENPRFRTRRDCRNTVVFKSQPAGFESQAVIPLKWTAITPYDGADLTTRKASDTSQA